MRSLVVLLLPLMLFPGIACNRSDQAASPTAQLPATPKRESNSSLAERPTAAIVESIAEVEAWIATQQGRIVVVDLWALW